MLNFIFEIEIKWKNSLFLKKHIVHLQMGNPGVFMNKYLKNEGKDFETLAILSRPS